MTLTTWDEVLEAYKRIQGRSKNWAFRGHRYACRPLASTLERAVSHRFGKPMATVGDYERKLIREFQRHYYKYSIHKPDLADRVEWLAIMQHHGVPTRLLDWTYSFYIAVFFAIENAKPGDVSAVWALDTDKCWERIKARFPKEAKELDCDVNPDRDVNRARNFITILDSNELLVCTVNPFYLNERLTVQQGLFLAPCHACGTFTENFERSIGQRFFSAGKDRIQVFTRISAPGAH